MSLLTLPSHSYRSTRQHGHELIADWKSSNLSMAAFAAQRGLQPHTIYYWRKKLEPDQAARSAATSSSLRKNGFIQIPAPSYERSSSQHISIQLPNKISIHLPTDILPSYIAAVVIALSDQAVIC